LSYIKAYGLDKEDERDYNTASANWCDLLRFTKVKEKIRELMEIKWFNDDNVDLQTLWLINHYDYRARKAWIEIYNKLKKRGADGELPKSIDNLGEKLAKLSGDFVREMLRGKNEGNQNPEYMDKK
jgi:hypothetical protein